MLWINCKDDNCGIGLQLTCCKAGGIVKELVVVKLADIGIQHDIHSSKASNLLLQVNSHLNLKDFS